MGIDLRKLIEAVVVSKCPSCGRIVRYSGTLCPECNEKYTEERETACGVCGLSARECTCNTRELGVSKSFDRALYSVMFYDREFEVFGNLLYNLKRDTDRGSEKFFARELSAGIMKLMEERGLSPDKWYITYPPRTRKSRLDFGFDHAEGLCRRIAKYTGLKFEKKVLVHKGGKLQKDMISRRERIKNADASFRLSKNADAKGKRYLIVDDIITSGSTVGTCQELLLKAGAKEVFPVSVARTPRRRMSTDGKDTRSKPAKTAWFN